jgi:TRAP-type C4-dicarboxylate transport system permease small subunit
VIQEIEYHERRDLVWIPSAIVNVITTVSMTLIVILILVGEISLYANQEDLLQDNLEQ